MTQTDRKRVFFKEYKGKKIYYVDYSDIQDANLFVKIFEQVDAFKRKYIITAKKKSQLMFVNFSNSYIVGDIYTRLKQAGKESKPYLKKQAAIGIVGTKKILFNLFNQITKSNAKAFETEKEALDWLVAE